MSRIKENLLLKIIIPMADFLQGSDIYLWYKRINSMNTWSQDKIIDWQEKKLTEFVSHAYNHTKYYKSLFDDLDLRPEDIKSIEDLQKIPVLRKETVKSHFADFIADDIASMKYRENHTGGSTGEPMKFFYNEDVWSYDSAAKIIAWETAGYRYGDRFIALGSSSLFGKKTSIKKRIYDIIRQEYPLNSLNINDQKCADYISFIKKRRIKYIYGYASSIYLFAEYILKNKIIIPQIKGVFTTSENLTEKYRATIQEAFHCNVIDCYGARDAGISAYEITPRNYHIGYNTIAELIDNIDDNKGTIITTNVLNNCFPLIRYEYGDIVSLDVDYTEYNGQLIHSILGRTSDVLVLDNGNYLTCPGFTVLMQPFDIKAYEIRKISGSNIEITLVKKDEFTEKQASDIYNEIKKYVGDSCEVSIVYAEEINTLANGKRHFFYV